MNFFPLIFSIPRLVTESVQIADTLSSNKQKASTLSTFKQINQSLGLGVDVMNTVYLSARFSFLPLVLLEASLRINDIVLEILQVAQGKKSKKMFITSVIAQSLNFIRLSQEYQKRTGQFNTTWILSSSVDLGLRFLSRSLLKN